MNKLHYIEMAAEKTTDWSNKKTTLSYRNIGYEPRDRKLKGNLDSQNEFSIVVTCVTCALRLGIIANCNFQIAEGTKFHLQNTFYFVLAERLC